MNRTKRSEELNGKAVVDVKGDMMLLTVDTEGLRKILSCGRETAVRIGTEASARVKVNGRVLWNVGKIREYLDEISE